MADLRGRRRRRETAETLVDGVVAPCGRGDAIAAPARHAQNTTKTPRTIHLGPRRLGDGVAAALLALLDLLLAEPGHAQAHGKAADGCRAALDDRGVQHF